MQDVIREEPFFARFLEGGEYPEVQSDLHAGRWGGGGGVPIVTHKYPSDDDEWPTM